MSKKHWFYDSGFYRFMTGSGKVSSKVSNGISNLVNSIIGKYFGTNMTGADIEASDRQLQNQRILNEEDYSRKVEFFNNYESYPAQVRQMSEAGLNPALMYQGGASVSASGGVGTGSASMPHSSGADLLSSLIPALTNLQKIETDKVLRNRELDQRDAEIEIERERNAAYTSWLGSQTEGQNITNRWLDDMFGAQLQDIEANVELKQSNSQLLASKLLTEGVQRDLMRHNIKLIDAEKAATEIQKAILETQKKHADDYFSALAGYQLAISELTSAQNTLFRKTLIDRADKAKWELLNLIVETGKEYDIWTGEAFQLGNEGKMTSKEKTQLWTGVISSLLTTGVGLAGGYVLGKGVRVPAPMSIPSYSPFDPSSVRLPNIPSNYYRPTGIWTP